VTFCPEEHRLYVLDCILDSGAQLSLAKFGAIPKFYWETSTELGSSIDGNLVPLKKIVHNFPISIVGHKFGFDF